MRCAICGRPLYESGETLDRALVECNDDFGRLNEAYGWRSKWQPELCRRCDTAHDHRRKPSVWQRLKRRTRPAN